MNTRKLSYSKRHLIALWIVAIISALFSLYLYQQMPELFDIKLFGPLSYLYKLENKGAPS